MNQSGPRDRIARGGGKVIVGADGVTSITPALAHTQVQGIASVLLESRVIAANTATVDFPGAGATYALDNTYDAYLLKIVGARPVSNDAEAWIRLKDNTPAWLTANYNFHSLIIAGGIVAPFDTGATKILLTNATGSNTAVGNADDRGIRADVVFGNPELNILQMIAYDAIYGRGNDTLITRVIGGGGYNAAFIMTAIRFMFHNSDVEAGLFTLYGFKK